MANEDCEDEVSKAGAGLPNEDAKAILQEVSDREKTSGDPMRAAREMADMYQANTVRLKAAQMRSLRQRQFNNNLHERRYLEFRAAGRGDDSLRMAVESDIYGFNTPSERGALSADSVARSKGNEWFGGLMRELKGGGLFGSIVRSKVFSRDVGRELFELSRADVGEAHKSGYTGNSLALQAAKIINKYQSLAKYELNRVGAWIGDYSGYITKTTHDAGKMWREGRDLSLSVAQRAAQAVRGLTPLESDAWRERAYAAWKNYTLPKLDHDRTFMGLDTAGVEKFMRSVWSGLVTNIHGPGPGMKDPAFTGPGNLAKKLSEERVLHFADADSWMDYSQKFGTGTWFDQIGRNLLHGGRDFALLDRWGDNPRAEFMNSISWLARKFRDTDPMAAAKLENSQSSLEREFGFLDGTSDRPENAMMSGLFRGIRNSQILAHLGSINFTHGFGVFVTKAKSLNYHGVGFFERYGNVLSSFWNGPHGRGEDMRHAYDLLGSGWDGQHLHYMSQFTLDSAAGAMSRAISLMMRSTGLTYVLDGQKAGSRAMMARFLGKLTDRSYGDLPPETQRDFHRYGISPMEWDAMRSAPNHTQVSGRTWLTPDAPMRAGPIEASNGTDLYTDQMRRETALKLKVFYDDVADEGIVQPGIPEKMLLGGAKAGTPGGEFIRTAMQFRMWPAAAVRQVAGREWYGRPGASVASRLGGFMALALATEVFGYLKDSTRDLLNGRTLANPLQPSVFGHAMISGGGLGLIADLFFGELPTTVQGALGAVAGPAVGGAYQLAAIGSHLMSAAWKGDSSTRPGHPLHNIGAETTKAALDNAPFINIWWLRAALNYAFLYHLQEWMNPGFHQRQEAAIRKRTGQESFLSPATFQ
jgi:hypothetical protein